MIKKSLSQNFLIDHNIAKKIANLITKYSNYNLIEVGPGHGFLTDHLLKKNAKKIILIEKDYNLFLKLKHKYQDEIKIQIYNYDALKTDIFNKIKKPKVIVSNLPYNISIKLITNWLPNIKNYLGFHLMIQKEVSEKFKYNDRKKVNRLNLFAYLYSDFKKEFDVSPNVFFPKPKVFSSVVTFTPNTKSKIDASDFKNFTRVLFSTKRKKIINNLLRNNNYKNILLQKNINDIDLEKRPEDLNFNDTIKLYSHLMK